MESDDKSEQLKQLIQNGKTRGYILYDEIDELLPVGLEGGARLDTVLTELARNGIEILEEPGARYDIDLTEATKSLTKTISRNSSKRLTILRR